MFWCFFSSSMASSMSFSGMYSVSFSFTCGHLLSQFPFPLFTFCSNSKPFGTLIVVIRIWGGWRGGRWWRCVTSLSVFFLWDLLPWSFPFPSWGVPFAFLSWFYWLVIWVVSSNWGFSIPCHGVVIYCSSPTSFWFSISFRIYDATTQKLLSVARESVKRGRGSWAQLC